MARIFISHSWANNAETLALRDWLVACGWDDLFLDIDSQRGLVSGQHWLDQLQESAHRCKAVLFMLSRDWLESKYCIAEFWEARKQERPLFAVVIDNTAVAKVPAEIRGVWQLVFLTQGSRFETFSVLPPPAYAPTQVSFSHEGLESLRRGLARAGLTSFETESFPWPAQGYEHEADGTTPRRPYRGLRPVDVPDAGVFFGRDADLVRARDHLADLRDRGGRCLVVLLGASGSGKSSFLRAGLLPRISRDDRYFLPLPVLRPRGAALWGDEGLLAALERAYRQAELPVTRAELRKDLEEGGSAFLRRLADLRSAAARGLPEDAKQPTLVIPIDQAEELFTSIRGETGDAEAGLFLDRLAEILRHGPEALVLVTIRSDAYKPLQAAGALVGVPQVPFNLPLLTVADYRSVIEGPAQRASDAGWLLDLEPELIRVLLADAQGADALPLLSFTLERLYVEHGGDGKLTLADYEALGGVQGSIEAAVAETFANPDAVPRIPASTAEREALLKRAFVPHLMGVNETNGEPVRRTARQEDLPEAAHGLIKRLIDHRLLVIDRRVVESGASGTVIEVAHEALLRRWPTLRRWHDQERVALEIQQEVDRASTAWSQNARGTDWLAHRGARLAEAEAVARRDDFAKIFEGVPRAYLNACRKTEDAARDAEAMRLNRQRALQRRVSVLLMVVAIVTLMGGWLVVTGQRDLGRQTSQLIADNAQKAFEAGHYGRAMRLALVASQDMWLMPPSVDAEIQLGRAAYFSRIEAALTGHQDAVMTAAFSPDGTRIVTASWDKTVRVWSRGESGIWASVVLEGHRAWVNSACFSPDGTRIVTASLDGTARVWSQGDDRSWRSVVLEGHLTDVNSASFSPGGTHIVTTSDDNTARVWSLDGSDAWSSVTLEGHRFAVLSAAFSPDGTRIVTASQDGTARLWSRGDNGAWASINLKGHQRDVVSASFSPDGQRIVTASMDQTARVWGRNEDGLWFSITLKGHRDGVVSAEFSPDGLIVTSSLDGTARVWSWSEDNAWSSVALEGHRNGITSASFSLDGTHIVTASDDTFQEWSRDEDGTWTSVTVGGHSGGVTSASFSPDGLHILTASYDSTARVWSRDNNGTRASVVLEEHQSGIMAASFSPDGMHIVTASLDGSARVWSRGESGAWAGVALEGQREWGTSASFSPDGAQIVTASANGTIRVWRRGEGGIWRSVALEGHQDWVTSASFSPDGADIVTASEDGTARVWSQSKDGSWRSVPLEGHKSLITSAAFSPRSALILTASYSGIIRLWAQGEGGTWDSVVLAQGQGSLRSASFSPDGARIVTTLAVGNARVWDRSENGAWVSSVALEGHQGSVRSATFSPDGTRIVTASYEGIARVWSQREDGTWTSVALEGHHGPVNSASFSPEGARIVTASSDSTARVWKVR